MSSLIDLDPEADIVLMVEVRDEATYVRHHKQKIAFLFAAMRHFAEELREQGVRVEYVRLNDRGNTAALPANWSGLSRHMAPPAWSSPSRGSGGSGR